MAWAKPGPPAISARHGHRRSQQRFRRGQAIEKAPSQAIFAAHGAAEKKQLRSAAQADDARQHGASAHVAAGQAHPVEQECHLGGCCTDAKIRRHGQDRAGSGADAIHRGDDGLRASAHRLDQIARHLGESQKPLGVFLHQRADDLEHIAAGAEIAAFAGQAQWP